MICPTCGAEYQPNDGTACVSDTVLVFPTVGTKAKTWELTLRQVNDWQKDYPALNVLQECRNALNWIKAHQERRKTPGGMPRMLVGWLNRQTNGGRGSVHMARSATPVRVEWTCPHVDRCSHREMCEAKRRLPEKYPERHAS